MATPSHVAPSGAIIIAPYFPCPASLVERIILPNNEMGRRVLDAILSAKPQVRTTGKNAEATHEDQP